MSTLSFKKQLVESGKPLRCIYCNRKLQLHDDSRKDYATLEHLIERYSPFEFLRQEEEFLFLACAPCNNIRGAAHLSISEFATKKNSPNLRFLIGKIRKITSLVQEEFDSFLTDEQFTLPELRELLRDLLKNSHEIERKHLLPILEKKIYEMKKKKFLTKIYS